MLSSLPFCSRTPSISPRYGLRCASLIFGVVLIAGLAAMPPGVVAQQAVGTAESAATDRVFYETGKDTVAGDGESRGGHASNLTAGERSSPGEGEVRGGSGFGAGGSSEDGTSAWERTLVDAFEMGMRSSQRGGSLNLGSLMQMGSRLSQDAGRGQSGALGTALGVLPKMNQLMNQGLELPFGTSKGKFQFGYHDQIGQSSNGMGGDIGRGSAEAAYQTGFKHDLLHFSATATYGGMGGGGGFGSGGGQGATSFGGSGGSGAGIGSGSGGSGMFSGGMGGEGMGRGEGHGGGMSMGDTGGGHGGMGGPGGGQGGGHGKSGGGATTPAVSLKLSF